jgi:hypothetical protein
LKLRVAMDWSVAARAALEDKAAKPAKKKYVLQYF